MNGIIKVGNIVSLQVILAFVFIAAAYKFSDWKNWRAYYSTMLFWAFGDLMYRFLFGDKALWLHYTRYLSEKQIELIWILVINPCTSLLFLTFYLKQKSLKDRIYYILFWIAGYSMLELIMHELGLIIYCNGWNFYWSVAFYFLMFPILILHYFKPPWAILVCAACGVTLMYIFLGTISI